MKAIKNPFEFPSEFTQEYFNVEKQFGLLLAEKKYEVALNQWQNLYTQALINQREHNRRLHKGGILHNLGIISLFSNKFNSSYKYFLQAYIEDVISFVQGFFAGDPVDAPGATNLKNLFEVNDSFLNDLKQKVEAEIDSPETRDPEKLYNRLLSDQNKKVFPQTLKSLEKKNKQEKPKTDFFSKNIIKTWDKRVFIGGYYRDQEAKDRLEKIKEIVLKLGYIPVYADDFTEDINELEQYGMTIHDSSLLLLHNCKYAIFDQSQDSGYLMEIERTLDYGTEVLVVQSKKFFEESIKNKKDNLKSTSMLTSIAKKGKRFEQYEAQLYANDKDLELKIKKLLKR